MRASPLTRGLRRLGAACALGLIAASPAAARDAAPQEPPAATDAQARTAVETLEKDLGKGTWLERVQAVKACAETDHRLVGERIATVALDAATEHEIRTAAFEALATMKAGREAATKRVLAWVRKASEAEESALAKGDLGVPVDRRTGDVVAKGATYEAAVKAGTSRAVRLAGGIRFLASGPAPTEPAKLLAPFVQSAYDDLAVAAVEAAGKWKCRESLPDLLLLFQMYPKANRWESGAVVHTAGSNSSAKAAWMRLFGHPLKQRARPVLHEALRRALEAITGRAFGAPEELDEWMATSAASQKRTRR